jgi:hypothetical protein
MADESILLLYSRLQSDLKYRDLGSLGTPQSDVDPRDLALPPPPGPLHFDVLLIRFALREVHMRILATTGALLLLTGTVWAQGAGTPPPTDLTKGTAMNGAELHAAIARLGDERPIASARVFTLAGPNRPYSVNVEHRTNQPQPASLHDADAEMFYVIDGGGTMVTGGASSRERETAQTSGARGSKAGPRTSSRRATSSWCPRVSRTGGARSIRPA